MAITVFSAKGGVGKTLTSLNLAYTKQWMIITNDTLSPLQTVMKKEHLLKLKPDQEIPTIKSDAPIIFDMGGHLDPRVIKAIKQSTKVIIPFLVDEMTMKVTALTIKEVEQYSKNIILLANKIKTDNEFEMAKMAMSIICDYPVLRLKESKALPKIFSSKESIKQMISKGGLKKYHYQSVNDQFEDLIQEIA